MAMLVNDVEFPVYKEVRTEITWDAVLASTSGYVLNAGEIGLSRIKGVYADSGLNGALLYDLSPDFTQVRLVPGGTGTVGVFTGGVAHDAAASLNSIYLKSDNLGNAYLCANMSTTTANKIWAFGLGATVPILHDASASVGGFQVFVRSAVDWNNSTRLVSTFGSAFSGFDRYLRCPNGSVVTVSWSPVAGTFTPIAYDDGAGQRVECVSPTGADIPVSTTPSRVHITGAAPKNVELAGDTVHVTIFGY